MECRVQGLMESYVPNEYPSLDKTPRVAFLGGSLDAVLLDSDDEDAVDKLSTAPFFPKLTAKLIIIIIIIITILFYCAYNMLPRY